MAFLVADGVALLFVRGGALFLLLQRWDCQTIYEKEGWQQSWCQCSPERLYSALWAPACTPGGGLSCTPGQLVLVVVVDGGGDRECGGEVVVNLFLLLLLMVVVIVSVVVRNLSKQKIIHCQHLLRSMFVNKGCAGFLVTFDSSGPHTSWHSGSLKHWWLLRCSSLTCGSWGAWSSLGRVGFDVVEHFRVAKNNEQGDIMT